MQARTQSHFNVMQPGNIRTNNLTESTESVGDYGTMSVAAKMLQLKRIGFGMVYSGSAQVIHNLQAYANSTHVVVAVVDARSDQEGVEDLLLLVYRGPPPFDDLGVSDWRTHALLLASV